MKGFKTLMPIAEAQRAVISAIAHKPSVVTVPTPQSVGLYVAQDIFAPVDVPPFDRAAFDGFAVRSVDTIGASRTNPIMLKVVGKSLPGLGYRGAIGPGEAVEIATGAPLPDGADAVVPYEEAAHRGEYIEVYKPVPQYYYVSRRGEDVSAGEVVLKRGRRIKPWDVGVLASLGIKEVAVYKVTAGLVSTGNELVELEDAPPPPGKIINSTRHIITALLLELGVKTTYLGIVPDDVDAIHGVLKEALAKFDIVITTGGVSVGEPDHVVEAVRRLKPEVLVHGIAARPGRPNSAAVVGGKPVIMLSGFPVASIVGFEVFVKPVILHMVGAREEPLPVAVATLTRRVTTPINVRSLVRVRVFRQGRELYAEPLAVTGSGVLSTLTRGNGLLIIPENREGYDEGDKVEIVLLGPIEEEK
ncbi:MAG: molybdopterin molybdotransferase MoeA [Pyrobaculum arsenaticum]|uniref:Molybdenum cofactor synthesis domain protein n=2 Tax=Pyrobaculum arsenaticum TaxID=121277 RepID=A4WLZ2_PYRAR|nr:gephyrin-like molybdotransferase Glp [Pyrobaculum arsenaticum]ABP51409.1 molybdenum cofactor synthesis domain protein [Pyrobaculum arsenaticum DSM 13514]MCY0889945.1 molybdopterin molybdotransferase MoeA [Pyrobaculum arsenaticum]NYR16221.1 molybdopterin molybdotransferase MoeA [Pyrobaculum arsenaticum]